MAPDHRLLATVGSLGARPSAFPAERCAAADFASFAAALAERYGPGGAFWRARPDLAADPVDTYEIWNEPDVGMFWAPASDPARYADLYLRARDAIKAVDPGARVIVGD